MKKCWLIVLLWCTTTNCFNTISQAVQYAASMPEAPDPDNANWTNPDFTIFYKSHVPNFFERTLRWLGVHKPIWDATAFVSLLQTVTKEREKLGLKGRYIRKFTPKPGSSYVMWGNLQAAFHSFVRDLTFLRDQGVLDEELHIIKPDYFFIFNGNIIGHNAYNLEVLTIILQLWQRNPGKILLVRGEQEDRDYWQNYSLKTELQVRLKNSSSEQIPFSKEITALFETAPLALYLVGDEENGIRNVCRISHRELYSYAYELNEKDFAAFLAKPKPGDELFYLEQIPTLKKDVNINLRAALVGEGRGKKPVEGLLLDIPARGAMTWMVLSGPTKAMQTLYQFYFDAFVVIHTTEHMNTWTLTLYNQDVRAMEGIKKKASYYLVSGYPVGKEPELTGERRIELGSTMDLSRGVLILGERISEGLNIPFAEQNAKGGVNGHMIRLDIEDDGYTPARARSNVEAFLARGIDKILSPLGSPTLEYYLDLIRAGKVLVLFPPSGAPVFRKADLKYIINFRTSYLQEGYVLTEYAIRTLRGRKLVFLYQNDVFGLGPLEGARIALKEADFTNWVEIAYDRNDVNFEQQAKRLVEASPDTILFFAVAAASTELIRVVGVSQIAGKNILGLSNLVEDMFMRFMKEKGLRMVLASVVPNPYTSELQIVKEYREKAKEYGINFNSYSLEAFIVAHITTYLLEKIGAPYTKERLIEAAEQIKDFDFKGLMLNFNPDTRELSNHLWLDTGEGEWESKKLRTLSELRQAMKQYGLKSLTGEQAVPATEPVTAKPISKETQQAVGA